MRKFHKIASRRRLFTRNLAHNLVKKEKIETTVARAKEIRPIVERLVTAAKRGDLAGMRRIRRVLPAESARHLFHEIAPRYKERHGGYLRITKLGSVRMRDGAPKATIEFVK